MPFFWGLLISLLTTFMHWLAAKAGYQANDVEIATTAATAAAFVIAVVCGIVQHYFPKAWAWLKSPAGRGPSVGLLLIGAFVVMTAGCAQLPANPTSSDIKRVQDSVTNLELVYTAFITPIDIEISRAGFDPKKRELIQAAEQLIFQELERAYVAASNGQNVDAHTLAIDLQAFKMNIINIQNGTPATQP